MRKDTLDKIIKKMKWLFHQIQFYFIRLKLRQKITEKTQISPNDPENFLKEDS